MVITYSIKPNIYGGWACQLAGIPYCANVQGLGTAFQKKGLAQMVTVMYKTVFFENQATPTSLSAVTSSRRKRSPSSAARTSIWRPTPIPPIRKTTGCTSCA